MADHGRPREAEGPKPLPTGVVAFLFTDIEGSSQRWDSYRDKMDAAVRRHDAILRDAGATAPRQGSASGVTSTARRKSWRRPGRVGRDVIVGSLRCPDQRG